MCFVWFVGLSVPGGRCLAIPFWCNAQSGCGIGGMFPCHFPSRCRHPLSSVLVGSVARRVVLKCLMGLARLADRPTPVCQIPFCLLRRGRCPCAAAVFRSTFAAKSLFAGAPSGSWPHVCAMSLGWRPCPRPVAPQPLPWRASSAVSSLMPSDAPFIMCMNRRPPPAITGLGSMR